MTKHKNENLLILPPSITNVGKPIGRFSEGAKKAKKAQRIGRPIGKSAIAARKAKNAQRTERKK